MDFERLDAIARQIMLHRRSHIEREIGHVYYHGARTMVGVIELRRLITVDASHDDLLRAAALFALVKGERVDGFLDTLQLFAARGEYQLAPLERVYTLVYGIVAVLQVLIERAELRFKALTQLALFGSRFGNCGRARLRLFNGSVCRHKRDSHVGAARSEQVQLAVKLLNAAGKRVGVADKPEQLLVRGRKQTVYSLDLGIFGSNLLLFCGNIGGDAAAAVFDFGNIGFNALYRLVIVENGVVFDRYLGVDFGRRFLKLRSAHARVLGLSAYAHRLVGRAVNARLKLGDFGVDVVILRTRGRNPVLLVAQRVLVL